jgi:hypothetical protein
MMNEKQLLAHTCQDQQALPCPACAKAILTVDGALALLDSYLPNAEALSRRQCADMMVLAVGVMVLNGGQR